MNSGNNGSTSFLNELDAIIAQRHMLSHPFYQAWSAGELTLETLRHYARQYYHHVKSFPRYLSNVHANCEDSGARQVILENLIEEERGPENHPELWLRFGEALGDSREQILTAVPLPETRAAVATFLELTREGTAAEGVAALYAYESQIPKVAKIKAEGLKKFYGLADPSGIAYFTVHQEADVQHAAQERELLSKLSDTETTRRKVRATLRLALEAAWQLLDGIVRTAPQPIAHCR